MALADKRCLFTYLLSELILWAAREGIHLAYGEGYVALTDAADGDYDGPHKRGGAHYTGLGMDLVMYRPDAGGKSQPVTDGGDPVWLRVGEHWEQMDAQCRWGGRFQDSNHFSLFHEGRS